ncbi:MAG: adenosylmethionine decarboxylase [Chloroflexi bacterium]|nr:adenosylmethionine decarboxylase [Chloroflexota bacterium]
MKGLGQHLILELWGGDSDKLDSLELVEKALVDAVEACGFHLKDLRIYPFSPQGITGVAVLSESHIAIHTWPEYRYAAIDVFTCGESAEPRRAIPILQSYFQAEHIQVMEVVRGIFPLYD